MSVLGFTPKSTVHGKSLKDGGCCLITNSREVYAISEERVSRAKHDGGYSESHRYLTEKLGDKMVEVEVSASSTCCEEQRANKFFNETPSLSVNHHLSHAILAFRTSIFNSSLIVVIDSGGNVLEEMKNDKWWEHQREQHSYFSFSDGNIELLEREFESPLDYGLGEFWRGITYAAGYPSSSHAAKVMELSSMGDAFSIPSPFYSENGKLFSQLKYSKQSPVSPIETYLSNIGQNIDGALPFEKLGQKIKISAWAQNILEEIVIDKLKVLQKQTGHKNVCLGGGVFLNCKLVRRITEERIFNNVHVSFAPSDKGQCIGNALFAAEEAGIIDSSFRITSPYIGPLNEFKLKEIRRYLAGRNKYILRDDLGFECLSKIVDAGSVVGVSTGRSEFGARALGINRCISICMV